MRKYLLILFLFMASWSFAQINVGTNFRITGALPIDTRFVFQNTTDRDTLNTYYRYDGLFVYTITDSTYWKLTGGITDDHWKIFNIGGSKPNNSVWEIANDGDNNWTVPVDLTASTVIIYNGTPLKPTQWSGVASITLHVNVDVRKADNITLIY